MKQYCRYCSSCVIIENRGYWCASKEIWLSESYIKHTNTCKKFSLCDQGDVITGRAYKPHKVYHGKQVEGQMSFGDYDDVGMVNQFDNMTGSMNL